MKMLHFVMFLILLLLTPPNAASKKRSLYFSSAKCDMNAKYLNNFEMTINADNTSLNILLDIRKDLNNIWINANFLIWLKNLKVYKQIVSYDVNMCYHLQRGKMDKLDIVKAWLRNILRFSNLTTACPFQKNVYYASNLKADKESIPPFTPAGRCRFRSRIYTKESGFKEVIGSLVLDIELK